MSKLSLLITLTSVVKGGNIYNEEVGVGELLFCKLEPENLSNVYRKTLEVVKKKGMKIRLLGISQIHFLRKFLA